MVCIGTHHVASVPVACKQAHIWEHTRERQRANLKAKRSFGRSLVTRREESEQSLKDRFAFEFALCHSLVCS